MVIRQAAVEFSLTTGHHRVDRFDLSLEAVAESRGVAADPLDDAVAAVSHQARQGIQLLVQGPGLGGQVGDQSAAARAERFFE